MEKYTLEEVRTRRQAREFLSMARKLYKGNRNWVQPLDDDKNIHKQKQMKQLAELNGLHEMNARCPYCGMTGHDQFKCPNRPSREKRVAMRGSGVRESGHPMRDLRRCRAYRAGLSESERQAAVGGASPHERRIHVVHERFGIGTRAW